MKNKKAFTLIELLVVIAIIAILMSILFPALKKAKKQVQQTICLSNLQQIGMAANLYSEEHDTFIPRGANNSGLLWFEQFLPYVGHTTRESDYRNVKIYRCAAFPHTGVGLNNIPNSRQTITFIINGWTFADRNDMSGASVTRPTKLSEIRVPLSTAYMADNEDGPWRPIIEDRNSPEISRCDIFRYTHLPNSENNDILNGRRIARKRHREGCNTLFMDWHAEYIAAEDMTINTWRDK